MRRAGAPALLRPRVITAGVAASVAFQAVLLVIGAIFIGDAVAGDDNLEPVTVLVIWCVVGTVYSIGVVSVLAAIARRAPRESGSSTTARWQSSAPVRILSLVTTLLVSVVGLSSALEVLILRSDPDYGPSVAIFGVWAMLLAWGLLHWGFAQIYFQQHYRAAEPPLRFPSTARPSLVEFSYFAITVGTTFSASDVEVTSTRMRFQVMVHSVVAFFFNSLIIVFAVNTILSAGDAH